MNVPTSETGTASSGMSVARQPCRKMNTTMMTSTSASNSVLTISFMPSVTAQRCVERDRVVHVGGKRCFISSINFLTPSAACDRVSAGQLIERDDRGRLSVESALEVVSLRAELDSRHVLDPHDRAVGVRANHDLAEFLRRLQSALRAHGVGVLLPFRHRLAADLARPGSRCSVLWMALMISGTVMPSLAN